MRVLLLSGGVDSTALAYMLRPELALTLDYGQQSARAEIDAASQIAAELKLNHRIIAIDCSLIGSGDMCSSGKVSTKNVVSEWWPFRNQLLATFAAATLIEEDSAHLLFGTVKTDRVHADGTNEFFRTLNALLQLQEGNVTVDAPAIHLTTQELLLAAAIPSGLISWSYSCHRGNVPCGSCRGCHKRRQVLIETRLQR